MTLRDRLKALLEPIPVVGDDDEFDPFAEDAEDAPPESEGDDRVHARNRDG
jgi:hypothetical protein